MGDRDLVAAVLAAQVAAWNRGDLDGFMAGYSDDVVYTSGGAVLRGADALRAHYRIGGTLRLEVVDVRVGTDTAIVLGRFALGSAAGMFTLVLERRPEGWRIVHDHTS